MPEWNIFKKIMEAFPGRERPPSKEQLAASRESLLRLIDQLNQEVDEAIENSVNAVDMMVIMFGGKNANPEVSERFKKASIEFSFKDIFNLTSSDFEKLQEYFQAKMREVFRKNKMRLPELAHSMIDPFSNRNIIQHEKEHVQNIPEDVRDAGVLQFTFIKPSQLTGGLPMNAAAIYDSSKVSDEMRAYASCEPSSLSDGDREDARRLAKETNDTAVIAEVERRIAAREYHGSM